MLQRNATDYPQHVGGAYTRVEPGEVIDLADAVAGFTPLDDQPAPEGDDPDADTDSTEEPQP